MQEKQDVPFGLKKVSKDLKKTLVQDIFSSVAGRYDIMNDVMSFGLHRVWKDKFIANMPPLKDKVWVDVASGTGDLPLRYLRKKGEGHQSIFMVEPNGAMLAEARDKCINAGFIKGLQFIEAFGEDIPLTAESADVYTISFGMRNVSDIKVVLKEAARLLKPGGTFLCMEFIKPENETFKKAYDFYLFKIIPKLGKAITGDGASYTYLAESIQTFVSPIALVELLEEAGFEAPTYELLNGGTVAVHKGLKKV